MAVYSISKSGEEPGTWVNLIFQLSDSPCIYHKLSFFQALAINKRRKPSYNPREQNCLCLMTQSSDSCGKQSPATNRTWGEWAGVGDPLCQGSTRMQDTPLVKQQCSSRLPLEH